MEKPCFVYILTNKRHTVLYTGVTSDLQKRVYQHRMKLIPGFTTRYNVNKLVSSLDARRGDITNALDGLNKLSGTLAGQKDKIANVVDQITPGLEVLSEQRPQLVSLLQNLNGLSGVAIDARRTNSSSSHPS